MKSKILSFLSGALVMLMLVGLPVSALAAGGAIQIEASPIQVLVNGEVFKPKSSDGSDALVFVYNGVTYAPLRALAEAYGLEVGYDSATNTATVTSPATGSAASPAAAADDFSSAWTVKEKPVSDYGSEKIFTAAYNGDLGMADFKAWWKSFSMDEIKAGAESLAAEAQALNPGYTVTMYFSYGSYNLGSALAFGDYEQSNFTIASAWIK